MKNRTQGRASSSSVFLPNFDVGKYVLVALIYFINGEKISLRWRGLRRIVNSVSNFIYKVEDLRKGTQDDIHIFQLKFYRDKDLNSKALMSHVLTSETGMTVSRLLLLK